MYFIKSSSALRNILAIHYIRQTWLNTVVMKYCLGTENTSDSFGLTYGLLRVGSKQIFLALKVTKWKIDPAHIRLLWNTTNTVNVFILREIHCPCDALFRGLRRQIAQTAEENRYIFKMSPCFMACTWTSIWLTGDYISALKWQITTNE